MSSSQLPGPHELGQNAITDRRVLRAVVDLAATTDGPIVEWAAGGGLSPSRSPDSGARWRRSKSTRARSLGYGALSGRTCASPKVTSFGTLHRRRHTPWSATSPSTSPPASFGGSFRCASGRPAILITQWEVARKRAGVGGATQLTAQWWPWYEFILQQRIPSTAFSPRPSVDAGLLVIRRRHPPLLEGDHEDYHRWVRRVFTGRGHGMPQILTRSGGVPARDARTWCADQHLTPRTLPKDLDAEQWASAYRLAISRH